jgi:endonuclease/exonuclease/phosphatase family metal-dependent hydrolase
MAAEKKTETKVVTKGAVSREKSAGLRTISYNVFKCYGYDPARGRDGRIREAKYHFAERIAMELSLYEPDIVTFQESPDEKVVAKMAEMMGMNYCYFKYPRCKYPGTVLTRFGIESFVSCPPAAEMYGGDMFTRHWGKAVLLTGAGKLNLYSAHLWPSAPPEGEAVRITEAKAMVKVMRADIEAGKNVILQGDLNHKPGRPEYEIWKEAGLIDSFAVKGEGDGFSIKSDGPSRRIDYVWSAGPMSKKLKDCRVLNEGAFRIHGDDETSFGLSDHLPVLVDFVV